MRVKPTTVLSATFAVTIALSIFVVIRHTGARAQSAVRLYTVRLEAALPPQSELPDFTGKATNYAPHNRNLSDSERRKFGLTDTEQTTTWTHSDYSAKRSDGVTLWIVVGVSSSAKIASVAAGDVIPCQSGKLPQGSNSGRSIGQQVYSIPANKDGTFDAFDLVTQDGPATVVVKLMPKISGPVNGTPVWGRIFKADITKAEDIAMRVLDRLTAMGHTSKPADSASKEARQQVLDWIAANPDASTSKP